MNHSLKSITKATTRRPRWNRNKRAFSMLSMAMLTILVIITITATGAALIPFYRSNATDVVSEIQARAIAESAINYTLALLNDPDTRQNVDVSASVPEFRIIDIQPADLNLPPLVVQNTRSIKVIIRNDSPTYQSAIPTKLFPLSFDSQLVSGNPNSKFSTNYNYWRTFTALVEYGQNGYAGPYRAGIKATIKPGLLTASNGGSNPDTPFFTGAISARDSVVLEANTSTSSSSAPHTGNIKAGGKIEIGANTTVDGSLQSISLSSVPTNIIAHYTATLNNQVQYYSAKPTINYAPIETDPTNLLNDLQIGKYLQSLTKVSSPLPPMSNLEIIPPALSPSLTPTTPNFPSTSSTGLSGDYVIDSSQLVDSNQLNSIGQPQSTIRLFLQNTGDISEPINISLDSLGNSSSPSNLELWYNGERPINFTGRNVSALVYAPYTTVTIGDGNKKTDFSGAVVGGKVVVKSKSSVDFFNNASTSLFSKSDFMFDPTSKTNANTIRWQLQTYKELHATEFIAERALTPP